MIGGRSWRLAPHRVYGIAHFGKSLLWNTSSIYFAFFLTEVVGLTPTRMGEVLAVSLFFNALCDLTVGRMLANQVATSQSAARAQMRGALIASLAFIGFAQTTHIPSQFQLGFALVSLTSFRIGYSLLDVPQNSFMAFASQSDAERADYAAVRYVASGLSILVITLMIAPLVQIDDVVLQGWLFSAISIALAALTFAGAVYLGRYSAIIERPDGCESVRAIADLEFEDRNGNSTFPLLLVCILVFSSCSPLFSKLETYFTAYVLDGLWLAFAFMPLVAIGQIAGQKFWPMIATRCGLTVVLAAAAACWGGFAALFWLAAIDVASVLVLVALGYGMAWGGVAMAVWALLAKSCAGRPDLTTRRYGLFTFTSKTAQGVALLAIGQMLSNIPYRESDVAQYDLVEIMVSGPMVAGCAIVVLSFIIHKRAGARQTH